MIDHVEKNIRAILFAVGIKNPPAFTSPPRSEMGDLALPCFDIAKKEGKNPVEMAKDIESNVKRQTSNVIDDVRAVGPFVNFFLNGQEVAKLVLPEIDGQFGTHFFGRGKKIMVEFAHPNTHKAFHIGHLRNIVTGESIVRLLENAGYTVIRVNYQGDVGMHIAKCLWGIISHQPSAISLEDLLHEYTSHSIHEKIAFLGEAYVAGSKAYEENEGAKTEIIELNKKIYARDPSIWDVYETTRAWSLAYFDSIYRRVGSHFDRLYFESEVYERGEELVRVFLEKGVFGKSDGAIIFPGNKYGAHDRVFITSQGFPVYEAKEMALGELQFSEHHPDQIIHVVSKEQSGYFEVVFKALEQVVPESKEKEKHLIYGWVHLKEEKMSSRTGHVVLGEWLLDEVKKKLEAHVALSDRAMDVATSERVTMAAVKYGFLKTGVGNDIEFDLEKSIRTSGDSGPYLLYIVARIRSIQRKAGGKYIQSESARIRIPPTLSAKEKKLILTIAQFGDITKRAAETLDPGAIAKYLFSLAQDFNTFYTACPVIQAEDEEVRLFRLQLIVAVETVMIRGLYLLGIEAVEEM